MREQDLGYCSAPENTDVLHISHFSYSEQDLFRMPKRPEESHKGTFGRVLCVCGSKGMSGAAYLAAKAAYRCGAGLVRILTVSENLPILQSLLPEAIVTVYDSDSPEPSVLSEAYEWADVLVIGCGLGITPASRFLLSHLMRINTKPTVYDADALNLIARNPSLTKYLKGSIVTPHPLEMARLCRCSPEEILSDSDRFAHAYAKKHGAVCVLKRPQTVVSDGGNMIYRNLSGNSGMATGGSGDVLAGMIGGILAQNRDHGLDLFTCANLGVYLHGLCGDAAAHELGEYSLMASDLINALPKVLRRLSVN